MSRELPVGIEFDLPEGWLPVPPEEVGAADIAFVALNDRTGGSGFTANITIDGDLRADGASLSDVADEMVAQLRTATPSVTVSRQEEAGDPDVSVLTQEVRLTAATNGVVRELVQAQVYLGMSWVPGSVVRVLLTATEEQFPALKADFAEFLASLRPERATPA
jgi:hypothetical protein